MQIKAEQGPAVLAASTGKKFNFNGLLPGHEKTIFLFLHFFCHIQCKSR